MSFWFYYMASLLRRGLFVSQRRLGEKKKEAHGARHAPTSFPGSLSYPLSRSVGTGRREPWERGWPHAFYFLIIAVFIVIPSGSLCGGERVIRLSPPGSKIRRILRSDWLHEWASWAILSAWAPQFLQSPVWRLTSGSRANFWRHP